MGSLIRFEFDKLFRTKSFYICTAVALSVLVLGALATNLLAGSMYSESPYGGWYYAANAVEGANLNLLLGIFTALFICEDNAQNTLKNIIARGFSRTAICTAKYLVSLCAAVIMFCAATLCGFVTGSVLWQVGEVEQHPRMIVMQLLVFCAYHALFFAVSEMLTKPGGSIAVNIMLPSVISLTLLLCDTLMRTLLGIKEFKLSDYWLTSFSNTASFSNPETGELVTAIVGSVIYTALFYFIGVLFARRKEV
jgi:ABC-type transport system involved in multi-copper enzyme maturation permease subunit